MNSYYGFKEKYVADNVHIPSPDTDDSQHQIVCCKCGSVERTFTGLFHYTHILRCGGCGGGTFFMRHVED